MKTIFLLVTVLVCILPGATAKTITTAEHKPSVYLTFERFGEIQPTCFGEQRQRVWLRLHNDLPNPVLVGAGYDTRNDVKAPMPLQLADGSSGEALRDGAEVELCYEVEPVPYESSLLRGKRLTMEVPVSVKTPSHGHYCSCSWQARLKVRNLRGVGLWVPSGQSVLFNVPRNFLAKNLKVYTLFNYEWEVKDGQIREGEPRHQVYFYSFELPKNLRPSD